MFDQNLISVIRRTSPTTIANEIIGVQPISSEMFDNILKIVHTPHIPKQGALIHSFIYGYQRYYGTEFISNDLWMYLKIRGL